MEAIVLSNADSSTMSIPRQKDAVLNVFDVGYHKTPPKHRCGPVVRPYFLLHLIKSGKGAIERNGEVTPLSAGEMFLIYPDETTVYYSSEEDPLEYRWISFYGSTAKALVEETTPVLHSAYQESGYIALKRALDGRICDKVGLLTTLFEVLNSIKVLPKKQEKGDVVAVAVRYLEENYFHSFEISELAEQLHYSRSYFSTLFQKETGETPYRYLNKVRMSHAKEYLRETKKPIEEIALSVGFSSLARFSSLFKQQEGISPLAYRKRFHQ